MQETTLYVKVRVKVKSDLPLQSLIDEFQSNTLYSFPSTENVEVVETEYLETSSQPD